jgi:mono/diheme cytochrome c family protein
MNHRFLFFRLPLLACGLALLPALPARAGGTDFERTVAPILLQHCLECHNPTGKTGGLDLSTPRGMLAGGDTGPAAVPAKPDESFLLQRVSRGEMPPKKQGQPRPLPREKVLALRAWIQSGAAWPEGRTLDPFETTTAARAGRDWWSLQAVRRPAVPTVKATHLVANPVDAFVLARLESQGWVPAPPADRRTFIRRLYFDLVGLPPSYEEVEAFARDEAPDACERLVDRLLASPHYGERWGRYWLDVARYAETCGYERDQAKPHVWRYRDWVIRAFNEDKPYDRFVLEQLAGDELPDRCEETVIATGFLRLGTWNDEPNDPQEYKYERLEDMVHATSAAFLAMTVKCARCHDHKFDPVRQTDYYRMAAAFWAGFIEPGPRELLGGPDARALGHDVLGWTDRSAAPPPLHFLKKGDPHRPGPVIEPGQLSMVPVLDRPLAPPPAGARTTQRRLQLARWIVDPRNPLTARVWVNRLWQYHLGQGLVRSPDNFGFTGERPTHPELLDWLASELMANGWRTRPLHRLILLSNTYRQASVHPMQEEYSRADAANRLWWRAERRRRDAEALRDALLAASGRLDCGRIGGPSFSPDIPADALEGLSMKGNAWKASPPQEQRRRSVYIFSKRGLIVPFLTAFDFADTTLPCSRRDVTTVAPQALALLNNPFVHQQSEALAGRVAAQATGTDKRIRLAWRLALGRDPRPSEMTAARTHLQAQEQRFAEAQRADAPLLALTSLCHVLLNANEFVYVD